MTSSLEFALLFPLGLTHVLAARAHEARADLSTAAVLARITEVHRETVMIHDGHALTRARPLPNLLRALHDEGTSLAVGDWVLVSDDGAQGRWLQARIPPVTHIVRRDADGRRHAVASNIDTALLVMGLDADFNPRRLERYLALVHAEGITPVVVLTKRDIAARTPGALEMRLDELRGRIPPQVDVVPVDGTHASAAEALAPYLGMAQTLVLLGSSGAGKSTLTNTLLGASIQDTGVTRESDGRGKHTTTARSLHRLPGGACVIDTPGLRTLRPDGDAALAGVFADIAAHAQQCRFRDCRHEQEPGCAVRETVDSDHLRNYHKLLREMKREVATPLERAREQALWKARGQASAVRMRAKRGE